MKLKKILAGALAVGMAAAYMPQTVMAEEIGTEISVDQSKVLWGDLEGNGNLRIEIYNEYSSTKNDPPIDTADIVDAESVWVTFTIDGVGLGDGVATILFADSTWSAVDFGSSITYISGGGTYAIGTNFEPLTDGETGESIPAAANGAVVFCVDIAGLSNPSSAVISNVRVSLNGPLEITEQPDESESEDEGYYDGESDGSEDSSTPTEPSDDDFEVITDASGDYEYEVVWDDGTIEITAYTGSDTNVEIPSVINGMSVSRIGPGAFYRNTDVETITVPDSVTSIGYSAFAYCVNLMSVELTDNVTSIEERAFGDCESLTSIVIPAGLTRIENALFDWCLSLESIEIPDGVTSIGERAFSCCRSLTTVTIPDGVTSLEDYAFYDSGSITTVTIPVSVTSIGYYAFAGDYGLEAIYYAGTEAQWDSIEFGEAAMGDGGVPYTIYFVADGTSRTQGGERVEVSWGGDSSDDSNSEELPIVDNATGIVISAAEGVLPENAALNVKLDEENSTDTAVAFDITVTVDGEAAAINGTVTVTVPVPEELAGADKYYVYYQADDGTLTDMNATYADGYITFTTTHFSTYIVSTVAMSNDEDVTTTEPDAVGDNEDNAPDTGVTLLLIPAIAAAAGVIISRKRK